MAVANKEAGTERLVHSQILDLKSILFRDRTVLLAGIASVSILGWLYLYHDAQTMHCMRMAEMAMPHMQSWGLQEFGVMFGMWTVMMIAMMLPSVAPMVLTFAAVNRRRRQQARPYVPTAVFLTGYLAAWTIFSVLATFAQWLLHRAALLSAAMVITNAVLGGLLLVTAGIFQWTPLKRACLSHCRDPLAFLITQWREGHGGALRMGLSHGSYCIGCCWALMVLLFVAGVMNLAWVALISVFVLVEKVVPAAPMLTRTSGILFIGAGIWMMIHL